MNDFDLEQTSHLRPMFIKVVCLVSAILYCLHLTTLVTAVVISLLNGKFFQHPIAEAFGGSSVYWFIWNSCLVIALALLGGFIILCIAAALAWLYRSIAKQCTVPRADADVVVKKFSVIYWAVLAYGLTFFGSTFYGIVSFAHRFLTDTTQSNSSFAVGVLVLIGPFLLVACLGILITVFWFCVLLLPCVAVSKRLLRYITRPSMYIADYEQRYE